MQTPHGIGYRSWKWLMSLGLLFLSAGSALSFYTQGEAAPAYQPPGPDRFTVSTVDYTKYFWWLIRWGEDDHECEIEIDHEGMPTPGDIYVDCGKDIYEKWVDQKPCLETDVALCKGFYVQLMGSEPA